MNREDFKNLLFNTVWKDFKSFKIFHAYARNYNFGDNALAYGTKNIFLKYFSKNCRFYDFDIHSTVFDSSIINTINNYADLFLVGGGGLIDTFDGSPYWLFNSYEDAINCLNKPICFFALGFNNFAEYKLKKEAADNIVFLKNKAVSFSVRNDGTKSRLKEQGLEFIEIPDPGFFVQSNHPKPNIKGKYVLFNVAYDSIKNRGVDDKFFNEAIKLCELLIKLKYRVVLAPHCLPDIDGCNKIIERVNSKKLTIWDWNNIIRNDNVGEGLGYYKFANFSIAMRGHAQICSIGLNTPVLSILNHPKHKGLLSTLGLEDYSIDIDDDKFYEKAKKIIFKIIFHKGSIKRMYNIILEKLSSDIKNYISILKNKVNPNVNSKT